MPTLLPRAPRLALSLTTAALLLVMPGSSLAAQDKPPCPFTSDSVVAPALGSPVHGFASATAPGFDGCEFGDLTIYRQSGPDVASNLGLAGLAQNIVLGLPAEVAAQVGALGVGRTIDVPGYQLATLSDLGDAALWVKDSSFGVDTLVVQRGSEVFAFQVLDGPSAQATTTAVARAVIANAPAVAPVVVPAGGRPAVGTACGLDVANAVADLLQRGDVTEINVIGGCHFVYISTTLDGSGAANAITARQICDTATEVAYTSDAILGVFVTDRFGHDRAASPAPGEPCSGFP
jgi:hypothetical protein